MACITRKGRELAKALAPSFDQQGDWSWFAMEETCSLLCRAATTYARIQESHCNGPSYGEWTQGWQDRLEKREAQLEKRIRALCEELPRVATKQAPEVSLPIGPVFQGDPRGATVKLAMPDGRYDDWGQTGICVPGA